ncbi:GGDEF domain-containing protein [Deinococcus pimensis]|uniref:GGDEF domain-containing protein n=1 Tax=Deinococcus pimensis TaxID=309888 RepID=UPI00047FAA34|nr:GGDEF domain-containing protein [Deinococcus pimensis]
MKTTSNHLPDDVNLAMELERLRALVDHWQHLALHDPLTGLKNRAWWSLHAAEFVRHGALVVLDLDDFKRVNDTYGHATGDEVLREVAARLTRVAGPDRRVVRLSGDEFAVLLPPLDPLEPERLARTLLRAVREEIRLEEGTVLVTASAGCARCVDGSGRVNLLLCEADARMYREKRSGQRRGRPSRFLE